MIWRWVDDLVEVLDLHYPMTFFDDITIKRWLEVAQVTAWSQRWHSPTFATMVVLTGWEVGPRGRRRRREISPWRGGRGRPGSSSY